MRRNVVETIEEPDQIINNINNSPRKKKGSIHPMSSMNFTMMAIDEIRTAERLFEFVAIGGEKEIKLVNKELFIDPKRHIYDKKDPNHLINRYNRLRQTPLYVACKNGNLQMVKFLLE
jgi:ankyrin repeat protein